MTDLIGKSVNVSLCGWMDDVLFCVGAFVEGLVRRPVDNYETVSAVLEEGHGKRAVAETAMNAESSRSHAVFTLYIRQKVLVDSDGVDLDTMDSTALPLVERKSKVCLIDLAGSERLKSTLATGERLQEATNINRSLFALGDVIKALSESGREDRHIPYRNSILTWILKDSLGGNSKTSILATISPIDRSHGETLNTLGYVERAKLIVNRAVVNEDKSGNPFVKHLQQQIALYKAKLTDTLSRLRKSESDLKCLQIEWDMLHGSSATDGPSGGIPSWERQHIGSGLCGGGEVGSSSDVLSEQDEGMAQESAAPLPSQQEVRMLREALASSMMEYNELNQRLLETEDLHRIDLEFYQDRLRALEGGGGEGGEISTAVRRKSVGGEAEAVQKLNSIVEALQSRLQMKDNEIFALKEAHREEMLERSNRADTAIAKLRASNESLASEMNAMKKSEVLSSKATGSSLKQKIKGLEEDLAAVTKKNQRNTQLLESKVSGLTLTVSRLKEEAGQREAAAEEAAKTARQREKDLKKKHEALLQAKEEVNTLSEQRRQQDEERRAELSQLRTHLKRIEAHVIAHLPSSEGTGMDTKSARAGQSDTVEKHAEELEGTVKELTAVLVAKDRQLVECGGLIVSLKDALETAQEASKKEKVALQAVLLEGQREHAFAEETAREQLRLQEEALRESRAEITRLAETISSLQAALCATEDSLQDERDEATVARAEISTLRCTVKTQEDELIAAAASLQEKSRALAEQAAALASALAETNSLKEAECVSREERSHMQSALDVTDTALQAARTELAAAKADMAALAGSSASREDQLVASLHQAEAELAQVQETSSAHLAELQALTETLSREREDIALRKQQGEQVEAELRHVREMMRGAEKKLAEAQARAAASEQLLQEMRRRGEEQEAELQQLEQSRNDLEARLRAKEEEEELGEQRLAQRVEQLTSDLEETRRVLGNLEEVYEAKNRACTELERQVESYRALSDNPTKKKSFFSCA